MSGGGDTIVSECTKIMEIPLNVSFVSQFGLQMCLLLVKWVLECDFSFISLVYEITRCNTVNSSLGHWGSLEKSQIPCCL
jgi:hypothetical protein